MRDARLVGIAAALVLGGCGKEAAAPKAAAPPTPVEAATVDAGAGTDTVTLTGRIERRREMDLAFRTSGVITRLNVETGDRVRAGQEIATLDPTGLAAGEQRARADLERAERDMARARTLYEKGFVSRQRLDDSESALKSARAAVSAASFDRRWARLVSPVDGVVLSRTAQAGEVVQPGQAIVSVADDRSGLVMRANAPDRQAASIQLGQAVKVRLDDASPPIAGQVTRVGRSANAQTAGVEIEVALPSGAPGLSGQVATAALAVAARAPTTFVRVPAEAILEADGRRASVLVVDGQGRARRRSVTFEGFEGDFARISGLARGARVITAGAGYVGDGDAVQVVDPAKLAVVARK